jgi:NAD-specific glutamate dehydrogenase
VWPEKLQANQEFIKVEQEKIRTDVAEQISKNSTTVSNASRNAIIVIENNKKQIIDTVKVELNDIDAHVKLVADAQEKVDNTMSKINELSRELNNGNGKVLEELSHAKLSFIKLEGEMSYLKQKIRNEVTLLNQINNKRDNASETLQKMLDERPNATLARHWEILETNTQVQFYLGINVFLIFYIGLRAYLFRKKTLKSSQ